MADAIKQTNVAGGVVLNSASEVLVVNQQGRSWSLPKGHIDAGESDLEAAKREIYEEAGIKQLEFARELGSYQRHRIGKTATEEDLSELKTITMFLFKTNEVSLRPIDAENPEARWVKKEDVSALLTHPKDKDFFTGILEKI